MYGNNPVSDYEAQKNKWKAMGEMRTNTTSNRHSDRYFIIQLMKLLYINKFAKGKFMDSRTMLF